MGLNASNLREGLVIAFHCLRRGAPDQFLQGFPGGRVALAGTLTQPGTQWIVHGTTNPFSFECESTSLLLEGSVSNCGVQLSSGLSQGMNWTVGDFANPDLPDFPGGFEHVHLQCQSEGGSCSKGFLDGTPKVTAVVIRQDGLVFGADVVGQEIQPVFQFSGSEIGFAPEDRFMVAMGGTLIVIRSDGLVFGADVVGREIQPVFQFSGAKIGFAPEDRFMVAMGSTLIVIRSDGLVFGADVIGREIQPVFQFSGAKIGFAPEDRFMVAIGRTLVVVRSDGLVFGAQVAGSEIQPVFQFSGAKIGFAPEDRFMVAGGSTFGIIGSDTLMVIRSDGLVFAGDVVGANIRSVFEFSGAKIGTAPEDRFMVTSLGTCGLVPQNSFPAAAHWELLLLPLSSEAGGPESGGKFPL